MTLLATGGGNVFVLALALARLRLRRHGRRLRPREVLADAREGPFLAREVLLLLVACRPQFVDLRRVARDGLLVRRDSHFRELLRLGQVVALLLRRHAEVRPFHGRGPRRRGSGRRRKRRRHERL